MKKWIVLFASVLFALVSCENLEDDLHADVTSEYAFYEDDFDKAMPVRAIVVNYAIGDRIDKSEFPTAQLESETERHKGYYIVDWLYYKNPITDETARPDNFAVDALEEKYVTSFEVTPQPAWLIVSDWKPIPYTVVLDGNGGRYTDAAGTEHTQATMDVTYDEAQALWKNQFERGGYLFNGWNEAKNKDNTVSDYADEAEIINLTQEKAAVITLYACWLKDKVTLSFSANGGEGSMDSVSCEVGDSLPECTFTAPTGYQFAGWKLSTDEASAQYSDGELLTESNYPNADAMLYAHWERIPYTLTLYENDGLTTDVTISHIFYYDEPQALPSPFVRTGYTFVGWNTTADGTGTSYAPNEELSLKASLALYAQWKVQTLTITYAANGATGSIAAQTLAFNALPQQLTVNTLTHTGYLFSGWNTAADGSGVSFADAQRITQADWGTLYSDKGIVLYAQWTAKGSLVGILPPGISTIRYTDTGMVFVADEGYASYQWFVDGKLIQTSADHTFTITYADYAANSTHVIVLMATPADLDNEVLLVQTRFKVQ